MHFGLFNLMTQRERHGGTQIIDDTMEMIRLAEAIGFETAWMAEHHFSNYSMCVSPLVMAAHVAAATRRIKLGMGVLVLPLYHPVRMVEEIGLVDLLSNGRLVVGIGTGYQRFEFEKFGENLDERLERSLEMAEIMERSFTDEVLSYSGKYYNVDNVPLCTRTLDGRRPEVYVTGGQPEMIAEAVKRGWIPFVTVGAQGHEALVNQRKYIESQYVKAGGEAARMPFAVQRYVYVTNSREDALDAAERILYVNRLALSMRFNYQELDGPMLRPIPFKDEPTPEQVVDNVIIGDAHHCAERMAEAVRTLDPTHWSCFMQFGGMDGRRAVRSLERFGNEVIPLLERDLGRKLTGGGAPYAIARSA